MPNFYRSSVLGGVLILVFITTSTCLEFIDPPGNSIETPRIRQYGNFSEVWDPPIVGELADAQWDSSSRFNRIVIDCPSLNGTLRSTRIKQFVSEGALAVIECTHFETVPGFGDYLIDFEDVTGIQILVVEMLQHQAMELLGNLSLDVNITVRIPLNDTNQWTLMFESDVLIIWSTVYSGLALFCVGFACYKLFWFVKAQGVHLTVPQVCLTIEIFANLIRAMYCFVDPIFGRRIFTRVPAFLFLKITIPVFVTSTLLILFYWREVMSLKGEKVIGYLDKFRVPCIVVVVVLFAAEILWALLRALELDPTILFYFIIAIYFVVCFFVFYVLYISGMHLLLKYYRSEEQTNVFWRRAQRTTLFTMLSTLGIVTILVFMIVQAVTSWFYTPWGWFAVWFVTYGALFEVSLMQIFAFQTPRPARTLSNERTNEVQSTSPNTNQTTSLQQGEQLQLHNNDPNKRSVEAEKHEANKKGPLNDTTQPTTDGIQRSKILESKLAFIPHYKLRFIDDGSGEEDAEEESEEVDSDIDQDTQTRQKSTASHGTSRSPKPSQTKITRKVDVESDLDTKGTLQYNTDEREEIVPRKTVDSDNLATSPGSTTHDKPTQKTGGLSDTENI